MKITIEYHKADNHPGNYDWFYANWKMLLDGGELWTSAGAYIRTPTGFVKKPK